MTAPGEELEWSWHNRPRPLRPIVAKVTAVLGGLGTLATMAAGWGMWSAETGSAVTGLLGTVPGILTALTALGLALGFVKRGEPVVTPLVDPRTSEGDQLIPKPGSAHLRTSTTQALDAAMRARRIRPLGDD